MVYAVCDAMNMTLSFRILTMCYADDIKLKASRDDGDIFNLLLRSMLV